MPRERPSVYDLCCSPVMQGELEPARLRLLSLIRSADGRRATTGVLAEQLGLTQPTITHHLGALFDPEPALVHAIESD